MVITCCPEYGREGVSDSEKVYYFNGGSSWIV
ncbi:hypothetical protein SAMN05421659_106166 [[Clostridium] fimetarium]|uniref:Uncharacterized protein n=1 Tax=[Clostridium] fimetarium TaxID=99656 RepID=A0A1I0PZK2_9FIRM|nr:hypothetical protein SAMN05421659_106166 [[Clostridium] fimetarium]